MHRPNSSCHLFGEVVKFLASSQYWRSFIKCWTNNSPLGLANFQDKWVAFNLWSRLESLLWSQITHTHTHTKMIIIFYLFIFFQTSADSSQSVSFKLEQLTKLLYSIEDKVKYLSLPPTTLVFDMSPGDFKDDTSQHLFFRLKVRCLSLLDMTVVTGNLSYQPLHLRCFCKCIVVSWCRKKTRL